MHLVDSGSVSRQRSGAACGVSFASVRLRSGSLCFYRKESDMWNVAIGIYNPDDTGKQRDVSNCNACVYMAISFWVFAYVSIMAPICSASSLFSA